MSYKLSLEYDDLPEEIPIFPLSDVLLLPRGELPLNIFEDRYLAMIEDAMMHSRLVGIIQPNSTTVDSNDNAPTIYGTGCVGRINFFEETHDGRFIINLVGLCRFDITEEINTNVPYRKVRANWDKYRDDFNGCVDCGINRAEFIPILKSYLEKMDMFCEKWDQMESIGDERLVSTLSMICPFNSEEKQALLEASTVRDRAALLQALMQMASSDYNTDNCH